MRLLGVTYILWIQVCKQLIVAHKLHLASNRKGTTEQISSITTASCSHEQIAHHARTLLFAVYHACTSGSALDPRRLLMCSALVAAEELPQAARWHRRDLAPGLIAAWRAVLRAIAPAPGCTVGRAAAVSKEL